MYLRILAFFVGVLAVQALTDLAQTLWALPVLLFALWRRWPLAAYATSGALWAAAHAAWLLAGGLDAGLEGETVVVHGTVSTVPAMDDRALRFEFDVSDLALGPRTLPAPKRLSLAWYKTAAEPKLGERWQLTVRLKRPWGLRNPGGFDFERWAFERGIRASGYVVASSYNVREAAAPPWTVVGRRGRALDTWQRRFGRFKRSSLLRALVLGEQQGISDVDWSTLRRTGTAHLLSVSGLHVSLAAVFGYALCRWGCCLWPPLLRRVPAQHLGWIGALFCAIVYTLLTGSSLPAQRAALMLAVAVAQRLRGRTVATAETFFVALFVVLLCYPLAVLSMGFWLSFGAIAIIFYTTGGRVGRAPWPWRIGRMHLAIAIGMAPLSASFFQQNPLLGPVANLIAIPIVSWVVFPLALAALPLTAIAPRFGELLFSLADQVLDRLWRGLEWLAAIDGSVLDLPAPSLTATLFAAIGIALLLAPRGLPLRPLGCIWLLPLLLPRAEEIPPGIARVDVLDAGQALAVVVRTERHTLLFDTGLDAEPVVPVLRQQRVRYIDRVIISHADSDHAGGLASVRQAFPIGEVLGSAIEAVGPDAMLCRDGMRWRWDGVEFAILHPAADVRGERNDASCVLRITTSGAAALLPGDIERAAESRLLRRDAAGLRADLLLAPHHGSASSSTSDFIAAVAPAKVVFAVGYRNRYGFPAAVISQRFRARGITTYQTNSSGMLRFELGTQLRGPERFRSEQLRYWHTR